MLSSSRSSARALCVRVVEPRRVEPDPEELDHASRDGGVRGERVLHVGLAEGAARLAEVLRDRAKDRDLACGQPGREHETVEAVVLGLATPGAGECVLERLAHVVGVQLGGPVVAEPEVVDPDRWPVGRLDLVRSLVADPDAHVLEQRQHVGEEDRAAGRSELEGELVVGRLERDIEAHAEVAVGVEPLDPLDVEHRLASGEVLAIGAGERVAVAREERAGAVLAELLRERVAEIVGPGARRRGEPGLDLGDVVLRDRALLRVDDNVEAREHDAAAERARLRQRERDPRVERREARRPAAEDDRVDEQVVLVDQPEPVRLRRELGAADLERAARLRLELGDGLGEPGRRERRVARDAVERAREDDLRQPLPDRGELALHRGRRRVRRLPRQHLLVEAAAAELHTELADHGVVEAVQLLVGRRPVDLAVRAGDEPVDRHAHREDQVAHGSSSRVVRARRATSAQNGAIATA